MQNGVIIYFVSGPLSCVYMCSLRPRSRCCHLWKNPNGLFLALCFLLGALGCGFLGVGSLSFSCLGTRCFGGRFLAGSNRADVLIGFVFNLVNRVAVVSCADLHRPNTHVDGFEASLPRLEAFLLVEDVLLDATFVYKHDRTRAADVRCEESLAFARGLIKDVGVGSAALKVEAGRGVHGHAVSRIPALASGERKLHRGRIREKHDGLDSTVVVLDDGCIHIHWRRHEGRLQLRRWRRWCESSWCCLRTPACGFRCRWRRCTFFFAL